MRSGPTGEAELNSQVSDCNNFPVSAWIFSSRSLTQPGVLTLTLTWLRGRPAAGTSRPCRCSWRWSWLRWRSDRLTDRSSLEALRSPEGPPSGQLTPCRQQPSLQREERTRWRFTNITPAAGFIKFVKVVSSWFQQQMALQHHTHPQSPTQTQSSGRAVLTWSRGGKTVREPLPSRSPHTAGRSGCPSAPIHKTCTLHTTAYYDNNCELLINRQWQSLLSVFLLTQPIWSEISHWPLSLACGSVWRCCSLPPRWPLGFGLKLVLESGKHQHQCRAMILKRHSS